MHRTGEFTDYPVEAVYHAIGYKPAEAPGIAYDEHGAHLANANGDGRITITDVVKLQNYAANVSGLDEAAMMAGDINGVGRITITDVVQAAQVTVGQRTI